MGVNDARNRLMQLGEPRTYPIETGQIPQLDHESTRVQWIADRIVRGLWAHNDSRRCASAWGVALSTAQSYAHSATLAIKVITSSNDRLIAISKVRLDRLAEESELDRDKIAANMALLKAAGALNGLSKNNHDADDDLQGEREQLRAAELIRFPGPNMLEVLRSAFETPGPALRELLDEYSRTIEVSEEVEPNG
jgi:hypothetical protein